MPCSGLPRPRRRSSTGSCSSSPPSSPPSPGPPTATCSSSGTRCWWPSRRPSSRPRSRRRSSRSSSGRSGRRQTQTAQNAFRESQECVKRQEEQVEALSRLRETVAGKCEEYEETLRDFFQDEDAAAVSLHAWNEEAEAWLQGFFFTVRRSRLQMPQALCCDVMVVDTWTELGGSDQSLRHAASDPTIGTNFAGTGHTDLLAIRDGSATPCSGASAWSEGEVEALGRIEDIDT
mmetsp:Transcript_38615/g.120653  ORF Transcript_38615/g.120653 Transcript_38615/m.120653 type:complete len:233 (+) Transcript_38615:334-1032(+)